MLYCFYLAELLGKFTHKEENRRDEDKHKNSYEKKR